MKKITLVILLIVLLVPIGSSQAQEGAAMPILLGSTKPISSELTDAMLIFLQANPPVQPAPLYYWVSNVTFVNVGFWRLSVVAFDLNSQEDDYHLEMHDKIRWWNSLEIKQTASGIDVMYLFPPNESAAGVNKNAAPVEAGGGAGVWFPWESGKSVLYGMLGVHETGYAGTRFVDLVSGDGFGTNAAKPFVYASTDSSIVAICDDGQSVGIRMETAGSGDYYSYYHLIPASLSETQTFARGQLLGTLKYGTFLNLGCGGASQQATNYHLHWGFQPASGQFRAEDCILNIDTQKWTCNHNGTQKTISPTQWLWHAQGGTEVGDIPNDGGDPAPASASFWDMMLLGLYEVMNNVLITTLPQKAAFDAAASLARTSMLVVRMFYVLVRSLFDIRLAISIFLAIGVIEVALTLYAVYRLILKSIPGAS